MTKKIALRPMIKALDRAKENVGGTTELARAIGDLTPQAISQWLIVPPMRVLDVERATGVPRHELRSDIYPPSAGTAT